MALEKSFTCTLPNGLHARPASALEETVRGFVSDVVIINQRTQHAANAKSILALVAADIRHLDPCLAAVNGPDEKAAMASLSDFIDNRLPLCDEALAPEPAATGQLLLPPCLASAQVIAYPGVPVVCGIAQGRIVRADGFLVPLALVEAKVEDPAEEWSRLRAALEKLAGAYNERLASAAGLEASLLKVHRSIARDAEFQSQLQNAVLWRRRSAAGAIADAEERLARRLAESGSALLRDRALDIQDVCRELLRQRYGAALNEPAIELTNDSIVLAESLTPGQFMALDRRFLRGLALAHGGATSHTVILARAFNIPTLVGVRDLATVNADEAVVDADLGALVTQLGPAARRYYDLERERLTARKDRLHRLAQGGRAIAIKVFANISSVEEAGAAFEAGAEGVGLFRTEMIFDGRASAPSEDEQFAIYRRALELARGKTVVIRTLDVGGDKPLRYLNLASEPNPFLGYRAVRLYPEFESLFASQIRALLRASPHGSLKIMIPMIATVEEAAWVKNIIDREARARGLVSLPPVGAMIEVPAAIFSLSELRPFFAFFSIGSNDLLQYVMAADRGAPRLHVLYDPLQPAFLRALQRIIDTVAAWPAEVSLCGEMGGQIECLPLLAGSGLNIVSAAAPSIAAVKAELADLAPNECRQLWQQAVQCPNRHAVAALLDQFTSNRTAPLLDPSLIAADVDARSKEEAIKIAVDRLFILGRTDNPRAVEEAVWTRERATTTGFGHGFAIPHGKTNAIRSHSLVALKFRNPVPWDSLDGLPVRVMILLAIRETDSAVNHLKTLAKLARLLMDEHFRARLQDEDAAEALACFLHEALGV